jgi:protein-tyrosine phosphatase
MFTYLTDITDITDIIHNVLSKGGKVLVHCQIGASRSPTIIAAYINTNKYSLTDTIKYIQSKRQVAFFCNNIVFKDALTLFSKKYKYS